MRQHRHRMPRRTAHDLASTRGPGRQIGDTGGFLLGTARLKVTQTLTHLQMRATLAVATASCHRTNTTPRRSRVAVRPAAGGTRGRERNVHAVGAAHGGERVPVRESLGRGARAREQAPCLPPRRDRREPLGLTVMSSGARWLGLGARLLGLLLRTPTAVGGWASANSTAPPPSPRSVRRRGDHLGPAWASGGVGYGLHRFRTPSQCLRATSGGRTRNTDVDTKTHV